jgi:hypothetical protein
MTKAESNKWAKIFQVGDHQVLITKEGFNDEDEAHETALSAYVDGTKFTMKFGHKDEKKANAIFDQYDESMAERWLEDTVLPLCQDTQATGD